MLEKNDWNFYDSMPNVGDLIIIRDSFSSLEICEDINWVYNSVGWTSIKIDHSASFVFLGDILVEPPIYTLGQLLWRVLYKNNIIYLKYPYRWKKINLSSMGL
jgi:signal peptidase I